MAGRRLFHVMILEDDEAYTPERIQDLLRAAEAQGHPLEAGSYLEQMSIRQVDALVHGRTDA